MEIPRLHKQMYAKPKLQAKSYRFLFSSAGVKR